MDDVAFYTLGDANYFPGIAALIGSLRAVGHTQPIYVLDLGLRDDQRARLTSADAVHVVATTTELAPYNTKAIAPLAHPAGIRVFLDSDVIVTRSLDPILEHAAAGKIVGFTDGLLPERFFPQWGELIDGLPAERRHPHVNTGFFVLPAGPLGDDALNRFATASTELDVELTGRAKTAAGRAALWQGLEPFIEPRLSYSSRRVRDLFYSAYTLANNERWVAAVRKCPYWWVDQDLFNAVANAVAEPDEFVALDHDLCPWPLFAGLRIDETRIPRCVYQDGREPFAMHHVGSKPWNVVRPQTVFSRLLTQLVLDPAAPVRLEPSELPRRLRGAPHTTLYVARDLALMELRAVARKRPNADVVPAPE